MEWCCYCLGAITDSTHHDHCMKATWECMCLEYSENKRRAAKQINLEPKGETVELREPAARLSIPRSNT